MQASKVSQEQSQVFLSSHSAAGGQENFQVVSGDGYVFTSPSYTYAAADCS